MNQNRIEPDYLFDAVLIISRYPDYLPNCPENDEGETTMTRMKLVLVALAAALLLATLPGTQPALAGKKGWKKAIGIGAVVIGGAIILNSVNKAAKAKKRRRRAKTHTRSRTKSVARRRTKTKTNVVRRTRRREDTSVASVTSDEETMALQEKLNELGFDAGPVDGVMGANTRRAIADYQYSVGHKSTGELTRTEVAELLADDEPAATTSYATASPDGGRDVGATSGGRVTPTSGTVDADPANTSRSGTTGGGSLLFDDKAQSDSAAPAAQSATQTATAQLRGVRYMKRLTGTGAGESWEIKCNNKPILWRYSRCDSGWCPVGAANGEDSIGGMSIEELAEWRCE